MKTKNQKTSWWLEGICRLNLDVKYSVESELQSMLTNISLLYLCSRRYSSAEGEQQIETEMDED